MVQMESGWDMVPRRTFERQLTMHDRNAAFPTRQRAGWEQAVRPGGRLCLGARCPELR